MTCRLNPPHSGPFSTDNFRAMDPQIPTILQEKN